MHLSLVMPSTRDILQRATALLLFVFFFSGLGSGYSVLTHEEIVDLLWKDQIQPLLLKRFPGATEEDLHKAHAYAYGGCMLQDMGYYPFGNKYFSDLVHYVRSGDFVQALLHDSSDLNEYAFALGTDRQDLCSARGRPLEQESQSVAAWPSAKRAPVLFRQERPDCHQEERESLAKIAGRVGQAKGTECGAA